MKTNETLLFRIIRNLLQDKYLHALTETTSLESWLHEQDNFFDKEMKKATDQLESEWNAHKLLAKENGHEFDKLTESADAKPSQKIPFVLYVGASLHFTSPSGADLRIEVPSVDIAEAYCRLLNQIAEEWVKKNK